MKSTIAITMLACCLGMTAQAQQADPDPAVKSGNGKAAQAKKADKSSACQDTQGGVDVSGAENVEMHAKSGKGASAHACGKHNGKADTPEAAPTTAHPEKDPVLK